MQSRSFTVVAHELEYPQAFVISCGIHIHVLKHVVFQTFFHEKNILTLLFFALCGCEATIAIVDTLTPVQTISNVYYVYGTSFSTTEPTAVKLISTETM